MRLITAHKILISSAIVFFVFLAVWEFRNQAEMDGGWAIFRAVLYLLVAVGFAVYFMNLKRWYR